MVQKNMWLKKKMCQTQSLTKGWVGGGLSVLVVGFFNPMSTHGAQKTFYKFTTK